MLHVPTASNRFPGLQRSPVRPTRDGARRVAVVTASAAAIRCGRYVAELRGWLMPWQVTLARSSSRATWWLVASLGPGELAREARVLRNAWGVRCGAARANDLRWH
jgi:hypothetical protein